MIGSVQRPPSRRLGSARRLVDMTTEHAPRLRPSRHDGTAQRVLVVDDEPFIRELLTQALSYEGWDVRTAQDGAEAVEAARAFRPDAVLLDVVLPDMSGFEVIGRLRAEAPGLRVVFVSALDGEEDRIAGLAAGGDGYILKPFRLEDVTARLRTLLRRPLEAAGPSGVLAVGDLTLDDEWHQATRGGDVIPLPLTEYELLRHLVRNARRVLTRDEILHWVWRYDFQGESSVLDLYMSSLCRKIDAGRSPMIHTVRGGGYLLEPAP
jgi:two-component system OmpR family response regulator